MGGTEGGRGWKDPGLARVSPVGGRGGGLLLRYFYCKAKQIAEQSTGAGGTAGFMSRPARDRVPKARGWAAGRGKPWNPPDGDPGGKGRLLQHQDTR